jgi:hypothetical protein
MIHCKERIECKASLAMEHLNYRENIQMTADSNYYDPKEHLRIASLGFRV